MSASPAPAAGRDWDEFILVVAPAEETRTAVQSVADTLGCISYECAGVVAAMKCLRLAQILLVVCEETLPDGDWTTLLAETERLPYHFGLIVISGSFDCRQRIEELNLHGYDIAVASPGLDSIRRVVSLVAARWHKERMRTDTGLGKPPSQSKAPEPPERFVAGDD